MKKTLSTLLSVLFCAITFAQSVPQGINYQAVARDSTGSVLAAENLTIQFSIISDTTISWQETHQETTNEYGLFTVIIGQGASTSIGGSSSFGVVDWGASTHSLQVEIDYGNGFIDMGTTDFMSVPYALTAGNSQSPNNHDFSNISCASKADLSLPSQPQYGEAIIVKAYGNLTNGDPVGWYYDSSAVYAKALDSNFVLTDFTIMGICLENIADGASGKVLIDGFATARNEYMSVINDNSAPPAPAQVSLNSSTSGNTFTVYSIGSIFYDSGGQTGNYQSNENFSITFDAGAGNTIELEVDDLFFEHTTISLWDRLGFQVSDDGSIWTNADIAGLIETDSTDPNQLIAPWPPNGVGVAVTTQAYSMDTLSRGWIFPWSQDSQDGLIETRQASGITSNELVFFSPQDDMKRYIRFYFKSDSSQEYAGWEIIVKSSAPATTSIGSGFSMNSSPAVQFGSLVCGNSDNNSLLIHLNTK
jgi:hypothetical protein